MAKKKQNLFKNFFRKTFGKKFTIADGILLAIIIGYPLYIFFTGNIKEIIEDGFKTIWVLVIFAYIINILIRKAKR